MTIGGKRKGFGGEKDKKKFQRQVTEEYFSPYAQKISVYMRVILQKKFFSPVISRFNGAEALLMKLRRESYNHLFFAKKQKKKK